MNIKGYGLSTPYPESPQTSTVLHGPCRSLSPILYKLFPKFVPHVEDCPNNFVEVSPMSWPNCLGSSTHDVFGVGTMYTVVCKKYSSWMNDTFTAVLFNLGFAEPRDSANSLLVPWQLLVPSNAEKNWEVPRLKKGWKTLLYRTVFFISSWKFFLQYFLCFLHHWIIEYPIYFDLLLIMS